MIINNWGDGWKKEILAEYERKKSEGKSFFPYVVYKDMVAISLIFILVIALSLARGAHLEVVADPTDKMYNPRPEWYFLFLFQLLKYFPGSLETIAIFVIPLVLIAFLVALPFIDRGLKRHPLDRPFITGIGVLGIIAVVYFSIEGSRSPLTNPIIDKNPLVSEGYGLYTELRCKSCHSINGQGGIVGPTLDLVASRHNSKWLKEHFRNPQRVTPGTAMPNFGLLDREIESLTSYMSSLGGGAFSSKAPVLFQENCASCHKLGNIGEEVGPDLSGVGQYRDQGWISKYIENPESVDSNASMPAFNNSLTKEQIEDLSKYLKAQRNSK